MVQQIPAGTTPEIIYPESDGQPMADNTKQFRWIVIIKENLEILFANNLDVFIAGDLLWYPVQGDNKLRQAPDIMVVFGRPKGDRGSYQQWQEENITPQVVFEILSPGNRLKDLAKKFKFYEHYGVEEYYIYDPETIDLIGWLRSKNELTVIEEMNNWVSPRLGIRFQLQPDTLEIYRPDGERFLTPVELEQQRLQERQRAETERQRANQAEARVQLLEARLRELGIDPNQL
jgi:Uma2 family endonuclease